MAGSAYEALFTGAGLLSLLFKLCYLENVAWWLHAILIVTLAPEAIAAVSSSGSFGYVLMLFCLHICQGVGFPGAGIPDSCERLCGCWELNATSGRAAGALTS